MGHAWQLGRIDGTTPDMLVNELRWGLLVDTATQCATLGRGALKVEARHDGGTPSLRISRKYFMGVPPSELERTPCRHLGRSTTLYTQLCHSQQKRPSCTTRRTACGLGRRDLIPRQSFPFRTLRQNVCKLLSYKPICRVCTSGTVPKWMGLVNIPLS
jgi:hypothetical protein